MYIFSSILVPLSLVFFYIKSIYNLFITCEHIMIVFYGRAKVWIAFKALCDQLNKECHIVDDKDEVLDITLLEKADVIVPTPGLPQTHHIYQKYSHKITSELDMCACIMAEQGLNPLSIGISWTDGKSTVTRIIAEALRQVLPTHQVHISGNFDEPMWQTILNILQAGTQNKHHIFVIECSSFMLYPTKKYHFNIGIRTNFAPDHLNWHPTMEEYFAAKQRLFENSDIAFTNHEVFDRLSPLVQQKTQIYPNHYDLSTTHFVGQHNEKNCAVAFQTITALCEQQYIELAPQSLHDAIGTIKPLKHRMQPVKTLDSITRYDDGKSTSAQSLGAALQSFHEPIIAICGWSDKGDSFDILWPLFAKHTVHGIFLWQTAPQFAALFDILTIPYTLVSSMNECVEQARHAAKQHNAKIILFSPGCASFDMFKNYEDRAHQFLEEIKKIG